MQDAAKAKRSDLMHQEDDPSTAHKDKVPEGSLKFHVGSTDKGGFGLVRVNSTGLTISHYTGDGNFLYEAPVISPRSH